MFFSMKITKKKTVIAIISIPIIIFLVIVIVGACEHVLSVISYSGYIKKVSELTVKYGMSGEMFDLASEKQFYYSMQYNRVRYDVRMIYIYGKIPRSEVRKIISQNWDFKCVSCRNDECGVVMDDLPLPIRKEMNLGGLNGNVATGRGLSIYDEKVYLCFLTEEKLYNVFLAIGAESGTMIMIIFQFPSGKPDVNLGYWFDLPNTGHFSTITEDAFKNDEDT